MFTCVRSLITRRTLLVAALMLVVASLLLIRPRPIPAPFLEDSTTIITSLAPPRPPTRLLPLEYWAHRRAHPADYAQISCSALPAGPEALHRAAASWQYLVLDAGNLYLYAAYWDPRPIPLHGAEGLGPRVAVLVYCDVTPLPNITCLLWYESQNAPCEVPASATYGWHEEWGGPTDTANEPYVLGCGVQEGCGAGAPRAVSLSPGACPPTPHTLLPVQGAPAITTPVAEVPPPPTSLAVCLKWLNYRADRSTDLVEWIELVQALGADKIYIYVLQAHPHMRRVLRHYSELGLVDFTELDHPPRRREQRPPGSGTAFRRELLPLNDCLYRVLVARRHAWLAVFDMDELIVPLKDETWGALITRELSALESSSVDAIVFLNYYFLRGAQREVAAPPPAHMLAHVWRAANHSLPGYCVKSFFNVSSVVAMHNHLPMSCGARYCHFRDVPPEDGRLQHYRDLCAYDVPDCPELHGAVRDPTLLTRWRRVLPLAIDTLRALDLPLAAPTSSPPPPA